MKRHSIVGAIAGCALIFQSGSAPAVDVDIHITVPPPPHVVFEAQPEVVVVPQTRVEYVPVVTQYDMYRYGKYWYVNQDGYWYRSRSYKGPFKYVQYRSLPRQVVIVPAEYRHHPSRPHKAHKSGKKHGRHD